MSLILLQIYGGCKGKIALELDEKKNIDCYKCYCAGT